MSLRVRIFVTVTFVFFALIAATYVLFSRFLLEQFDRLERERASTNVRRVLELINATSEDLSSRVTDWGHWDESYSYIQGMNSSYVDTNLNYSALVPFELEQIIFLDEKLKIQHAIQVDSENEDVKRLSPEITKSIIEDSVIQEFFKTPGDTPLSGILRVNGKPVFMSITTITDNEMKEAAKGFLIFTRQFSESLKQKIAHRTKLNVHFEDMNSVTPQIANDNIAVDLIDDYRLMGTGVITDFHKVPLMKAIVTMGREIYYQGIDSRNYLMSLILAFVLVANAVILLIFERVVIRRLRVVARRMDNITTTKDVSQRLESSGKDEIFSLIKSFNHLLAVIQGMYVEVSEARTAAEHANAAKSSFLAKVSHEIRTPLHSILGMLRIIHRGEPDKNRRKYIDLVRVSANSLLSTINDLLDFSKAETGMLEVSMEETELRPILDSALSAISAKVYESGNIELLYEIASDVPKVVMADPHRLQQILVNLLGNSAKFTEYGAVSLVTKYQIDSNTITIEVIDSGLGIPEKQIATIFDPFVQVDDKKLKSKGGTGLGLTITKQLIEAMGGSIGVTSQVGKGSVFTITLPVREGYSPPGVERENVFDKKILLISNNPVVNAFYHKSLADRGALVTVAPRITGIEDLLKGTHTIVLDDSLLSDEKLLSVVEDIRQQAKVERIMVLINPLRLEIYGVLEKLGIKKLHWKPKLSSDLFLSEEQQRRLAIQNRSDVEKTLSDETKKLNIIIADDMPTNIIILEELLREAGHNVTTVVNGQLLVEALGIGSKQKPAIKFDLVFTDMQMPVLDGMEALQLIRKQDDELSKIPVILVTADGYEEQHKAMRAAGADDVIVKPFDISKLDKIIKKAADAKSVS